MQGQCKIYLEWEGFPKVTIYLKDERDVSGEQNGEKITF